MLVDEASLVERDDRVMESDRVRFSFGSERLPPDTSRFHRFTLNFGSDSMDTLSSRVFLQHYAVVDTGKLAGMDKKLSRSLEQEVSNSCRLSHSRHL